LQTRLLNPENDKLSGVEEGLQAVNAPDILTKAINKALMADDCALTLVRTL
jgi:hypothetical protein